MLRNRKNTQPYRYHCPFQSLGQVGSLFIVSQILSNSLFDFSNGRNDSLLELLVD